MNALRASSVSALLMLAIVGLSMSPASAQATCVESALWVDDPADDGWATNGVIGLNGPSDVLTISIGESGDSCENLEITLVVDDSDLEPLGNVEFNTNITMDFQETGGPDVVLYMDFFAPLILELSDPFLFVDGTYVATMPITSSGGTHTITVAKSYFGGDFTGITGSSDTFIAGTVEGILPLYSTDTFSSTTPYVFGVGFDDGGSSDPDSDNDGLPDDWEIEHFGDITSQDGTGDPDGDNLNNTAEYELGTDPNEADTDGDGFNDDVEVAAGTDPTDPDSFPEDEPGSDSDGDGLDDEWEMDQFGDLDEDGAGDPDGDGLNNTGEQEHMTNATNPDTDGDGFNDGTEVDAGTDPNDPDSFPSDDGNDSDGDGLDDDWEIEHFTNITAQDGTGDPDGDGCDNECEETNGTDPNDPDTDGDGASDKDEIDAETDPNDPNDFPEDDSKDYVQMLKDDWDYIAISGGLMLLILLVGIIALAGRWS